VSGINDRNERPTSWGKPICSVFLIVRLCEPFLRLVYIKEGASRAANLQQEKLNRKCSFPPSSDSSRAVEYTCPFLASIVGGLT
jgi:hypothetical protein